MKIDAGSLNTFLETPVVLGEGEKKERSLFSFHRSAEEEEEEEEKGRVTFI